MWTNVCVRMRLRVWVRVPRLQQEDSFTAQLADAAKALEESQEQLRVINEKWEQLLAEKEYLQVSVSVRV